MGCSPNATKVGAPLVAVDQQVKLPFAEGRMRRHTLHTDDAG
jgi:hypothetical protein